MEVKDINSIATMFVSNRTQKPETQNGTQTALQNFRELFTQGNLFEFQNAEKTSMSQKTSSFNLVQKTEVSKNKSETNNVKFENKKKDVASAKDHKADKSAQNVADKENTSVSQDKKDASSVNDSHQVENKQESVKESIQDNKESETIEKEENINEATTENATEEVSVDEGTASAEDVTQDLAENAVLPEMLNAVLPEMLQNMGAVTVYNALDNTYSVMTGEEIADLLNSSNMNIGAYLSEDGHSDVTIMPALTAPVSNLQEQQTVLEGFEQATPEIIENMKPIEKQEDVAKSVSSAQNSENISQPQDLVENMVDETISKQAEKLAEVVSSDKKINVKVDVKEENFSYETAKVTVKEVLASADVKQVNGEGNISHKGEVDVDVPLQSHNVSSNMANSMVSAQTMPIQDVNAQAKPTVQITQATKSISEVSNTNIGNLAGADNAAQGLKADTGVATENKSSFKDIYKGMSKEVAEQVKVNITKSAVKGVDSIEIKLKPEELGHIEIKMQLSKDGKLQAHIIASRAETGEMLQKELPSLEKAFTDAGFNLEDGSLSFSYREENSAKEQNSELRNFIGRVLEQDAENENNQDYGPHLSETWDGTSALNIRV